MTAPRPIFLATVAAIALAAAALATASDATARGRHGGGHAAGQHLGLHQHHRFHLQQFRQHRHHHQRNFFTRFTPCVVWTRQGWTNVCNKELPMVGSAPR